MLQKYKPGTIVRIKETAMDGNAIAVVEYTYALVYGGRDFSSYSLTLVDEETGIPYNRCSWYDEKDLIPIEDFYGLSGFDIIEAYRTNDYKNIQETVKNYNLKKIKI